MGPMTPLKGLRQTDYPYLSIKMGTIGLEVADLDHILGILMPGIISISVLTPLIFQLLTKCWPKKPQNLLTPGPAMLIMTVCCCN